CGEFVKRNWHGESPCAEGQSATGVLSPTLILSVRVQVLILNSPGGTRHHAMAHSATLQPLSGGAFLCRIHHSFWNLRYYSISQGAIFSDVMKACQQAGRIGNDPVEKTLTQIPVLSYRETGIT
ncbi:hypothetical protein ACI74H_25695, partial [Escherichia coli]